MDQMLANREVVDFKDRGNLLVISDQRSLQRFHCRYDVAPTGLGMTLILNGSMVWFDGYHISIASLVHSVGPEHR